MRSCFTVCYFIMNVITIFIEIYYYYSIWNLGYYCRFSHDVRRQFGNLADVLRTIFHCYVCMHFRELVFDITKKCVLKVSITIHCVAANIRRYCLHCINDWEWVRKSRRMKAEVAVVGPFARGETKCGPFCG